MRISEAIAIADAIESGFYTAVSLKTVKRAIDRIESSPKYFGSQRYMLAVTVLRDYAESFGR